MSDPTVYRRLEALEKWQDQTAAMELARTNYGSAFPVSWPTNLPFFRTDLGIWTYYNGTRWLSADQFEALFNGPATAYSAAGVAIGYLSLADANILVTSVTLSAFVVGTNNGTNFWTIRVADETGTIQDLTTAAHGPGAWSRTQANGLSNLRTGITHLEALVQTKTGAPGNIFLGVNVRYRVALS